MKDMLESIFKLGPAYIGDLLGLVQQPKRFVARRVARRPLPIRDALVFLTISFLLGWLIKMAYFQRDPWLEFLQDAPFVFLEVVAYGAAIVLAWRAVRGQAELQKFFVIHFYYSGVFLMLMAVWFMIQMGIVREADPMLYSDIWDAAYRGSMRTFVEERASQIGQSPAAVPMAVAVLAGTAALTSWVFVGWGAYRELNRLSRFRSALAAAIFLALWIPVTVVIYYVANAATFRERDAPAASRLLPADSEVDRATGSGALARTRTRRG